MAGKSSRHGAGSKDSHRGPRGRRRSLKGRGPTPKAEDRVYHKAHKAKQEALKRQRSKPKTPKTTNSGDWVVGRNPVLEALQAGIPVKQALIAEGAERDDRMREILRITADKSMPMLQVNRAELDRLTGGLAHQGVALQLPKFSYSDAEDVLAKAVAADSAGLVVALDGITDPRNLGAIIRSAAAFGAQGIIIPERRSASVTAAAWKTSAGAAARMPVAMVTNLNRTLKQAAQGGLIVVGLAGESEIPLTGIPGADGPLLVVIGSEGEGLSRLVRENCDALVSIPMANQVESLNASVAASVALYEINRLRDQAG